MATKISVSGTLCGWDGKGVATRNWLRLKFARESLTLCTGEWRGERCAGEGTPFSDAGMFVLSRVPVRPQEQGGVADFGERLLLPYC